MSDKPISDLRRRIIADMTVRSFSGASSKLLRTLARRRPRGGARCGAAVCGPR